MKTFKKGFTLIELLVVIAIIGILSSVVLASLNSARAKGSHAAAQQTGRGIMPELVSCGNDAGGTNAPASATAGGNNVCTVASHTVAWPPLPSGWSYNAAAVAAGAGNSIGLGNYTFTMANGSDVITCDMAKSSCQ